MVKEIYRQIDLQGRLIKSPESETKSSGIASFTNELWTRFGDHLDNTDRDCYFRLVGGWLFVLSQGPDQSVKRTFLAGITKKRYLARPQVLIDESQSNTSIYQVDLSSNWNYLEEFYPWDPNFDDLAYDYYSFVSPLSYKSLVENVSGKEIGESRVEQLLNRWGIDESFFTDLDQDKLSKWMEKTGDNNKTINI